MTGSLLSVPTLHSQNQLLKATVHVREFLKHATLHYIGAASGVPSLYSPAG